MATASAKFAEIKRFDHFTPVTQRLRDQRLVHRRYARLCISEEGIWGCLIPRKEKPFRWALEECDKYRSRD
jgi:hypothetical protein